jgi:hypothetical protein
MQITKLNPIIFYGIKYMDGEMQIFVILGVAT